MRKPTFHQHLLNKQTYWGYLTETKSCLVHWTFKISSRLNQSQLHSQLCLVRCRLLRVSEWTLNRSKRSKSFKPHYEKKLKAIRLDYYKI